jgi:hypothetical protein
MFVISGPGRGLVGAGFPGIINGDDAFLMPFGSIAMNPMHEALMQNAMGNAMQAMMEHITQSVVERSMQEQHTVPPASQACRDALPSVVLTKEDLLDSTNSKCSICLEEYKAGTRATRMFCGHLFCTSCIREWLDTADTCPVCRFELATDCAEYEEGRAERMKDRTARLHEGELRAMKVPDLRRVMVALGVSGDGCVEKAELISRLGDTPGVEVTPDREDIFYEDADLDSLELPLLRTLLERHRIPPLEHEGSFPADSKPESEAGDGSDEERVEVLRRFAAAGMMGISKAMPDNLENVVEDPKEGDEVDEPLLPPPPPMSPPPDTEAPVVAENSERLSSQSPSPKSSRQTSPRKTSKSKTPRTPSGKDSGASPRASASSSGNAAEQPDHRSPACRPARPAAPAPTVTRPRVSRRPSGAGLETPA